MPERAPRAGDRFPWLRLKFQAQGPSEDLFQKLDDKRFNLLVTGQPAPSAASLQFGDLLQVHAIPSDIENDAALAAASIPSPSYYLLRPDGHIGLAGTLFQEADLKQWLVRSHLRPAGTTGQRLAMGLAQYVKHAGGTPPPPASHQRATSWLVSVRGRIREGVRRQTRR